MCNCDPSVRTPCCGPECCGVEGGCGFCHPPRRYQTEPTIAIDKHELSEAAREAIRLAAESYPQLPADIADRPTLATCPLCEGHGMVTIEKAESYKRERKS